MRWHSLILPKKFRTVGDFRPPPGTNYRAMGPTNEYRYFIIKRVYFEVVYSPIVKRLQFSRKIIKKKSKYFEKKIKILLAIDGHLTFFLNEVEGRYKAHSKALEKCNKRSFCF